MLAALPLPAARHAIGAMQLQALYQQLDAQVDRLDDAGASTSPMQRPRATLLMTHPGVGRSRRWRPTCFWAIRPDFADGKALASYVGMIPSEYSSGAGSGSGRLSKQGNPFLRFLWGEAAMHAVRRDPELQRFYRRKLRRRASARPASPRRGSSGFGSGSCCAIRSITTKFCRREPTAAVVNGAARAGMPVWVVVLSVSDRPN